MHICVLKLKTATARNRKLHAQTPFTDREGHYIGHLFYFYRLSCTTYRSLNRQHQFRLHAFDFFEQFALYANKSR